jgi:hypothetical protein
MILFSVSEIQMWCGQPGSQILLAHQKYWLPITNRSLMNSSSSKSFGVYLVVSWLPGGQLDVWQVLVRSYEAYVPDSRTTNLTRNPAVNRCFCMKLKQT